MEKVKKTTVIGHRNPDTDSICSAIAYAEFKTKTVPGERFIAARAGNLNPETRFVLDHFQVKPPELVTNVKTQIRDIEYRETRGVDRNISLKKAWTIMQEDNVVTLPAVTADNELEGLITVGDITRSYMNVYDSAIMSKAKTQYSNIIETLEGSMLVGSPEAYFDHGKVLVAAANPDIMEYYIEKGDLVILGNRYESQICAIEMEAACIIVCEGAGVSLTIKKLAQEHGTSVITTPYDTYTAARLINQSMPISYFMRTENLITFDIDDYIDDIRDVMASRRFRDFPVLDKDGRYVGMLSRRNLLGARGKNVILVDHNERTQAVEGIENANILEIIDHHRLGTIETLAPVMFRNQPVGCTATILYQIYTERGVEISRKTAGLLLSAILSDTLLFRSPTCTPADTAAAKALSEICGEDPKELAMAMFSAGSELKGKTDEQIMHQDYKRFTAGKVNFSVGQITSLNAKELGELKKRMPAYMEGAMAGEQVDMMFLMLTNILTQSTTLLYVGKDAGNIVSMAFHTQSENGVAELPGVVSRKKQMVPLLISAMSQ
ncbi:putative manganese-dependent inorganic diphosphatase [Clostridium vitabionis]|uniref:putative manganese-dependent inorganic diphosphatase n=1 Tax=Clostridium vitabionis TaxID=2784388 RepID=UPI00188C93FA|nr:putative manganese-dependent inorganic diphosphatase [Clostridium vitabionis]